MTEKNSQTDIEKYATGRLTLLQMMGLLALAGIVLTAVLRYFFS